LELKARVKMSSYELKLVLGAEGLRKEKLGNLVGSWSWEPKWGTRS